jgi:REP element-mobilizing transposase RayT
MNRGIGYKTIFQKDQDYEFFYNLLDIVNRKFKIEIHAYCLMSNHYHLFVHTPLANLQYAMRHINGMYAQYYNRDRRTDGPLFRGRYNAILVDDENYHLCLSRYIHLNPVSAGICLKPENYKWSSYAYFINDIISPSWLFLDETLEYFGKLNPKQAYQLFVNEGIDKNTELFYSQSKTIPIFGSQEFIKTILKSQINNTPINYEISERNLIEKITIPPIELVMQVVAIYYNVDINELKKTEKGKYNIPRSVAMYLATEHCQQSFANIACSFENITYGGVSNARKRILKNIDSNEILKNDISRLTQLLHG